MTARLHCLVTGHVQGVFFRASTRDKARTLGLTGWARNLPDGRVEVDAQGDEAALQQFLAWLNEGPPQARVTAVDTEWIDVEDLPAQDFEVR